MQLIAHESGVRAVFGVSDIAVRRCADWRALHAGRRQGQDLDLERFAALQPKMLAAPRPEEWEKCIARDRRDPSTGLPRFACHKSRLTHLQLALKVASTSALALRSAVSCQLENCIPARMPVHSSAPTDIVNLRAAVA
jgi:hypothetical protein